MLWNQTEGHPGTESHLHAGVLHQAQLLLDLVELFLLPPDVGLQHPSPLLQLVLDGLKHAELCRELSGRGRTQQVREEVSLARFLHHWSHQPWPLSFWYPGHPPWYPYTMGSQGPSCLSLGWDDSRAHLLSDCWEPAQNWMFPTESGGQKTWETKVTTGHLRVP